ncbi:histone-lysine N-methyltransferase ASHH3-like isoform X2 [Nymphaea colorata]|uniref:histone-lysine N-methyltransferase ASHH3-like isoform X2 n=1 Tax=Nymphaea colorata TaxID=210225 RepID=UPI00129E945A|nr:histone-lysine N-methyltransferase ASHH3-like isoform X2 [Nymphaea colorata]
MVLTYMKKKFGVAEQGNRYREKRIKAQKDYVKPERNVRFIFSTMLHVPEIPVDFELPEWLKEQRSMQYTFIKRNVYLAKKPKRRNEDDGIFCSCAASPGSSTVCQKDCHCGMLLSCCSSSCRCADSCANRPFQSRVSKKMKVVKTEKCGLGLVAKEDISQGEFVIEYVGEVIDDKTCEERLWEMKRRGETNFYLCEVNRDMVIDATYKGNKSRFMNHSCQPNTEMQKWRVDGETRIGIFAKRKIKMGEPLTYDYQFIQFGKDQECYCGALGCRGKLGAKPSKQKLSSEAATEFVACEVAATSPILKAFLYEKGLLDWPAGEISSGRFLNGHSIKRRGDCIGLRVKVWWPEDKRFYKGKISAYNAKNKKHTILYDDGDKEVLDMRKERWDFVTVRDFQCPL